MSDTPVEPVDLLDPHLTGANVVKQLKEHPGRLGLLGTMLDAKLVHLDRVTALSVAREYGDKPYGLSAVHVRALPAHAPGVEHHSVTPAESGTSSIESPSRARAAARAITTYRVQVRLEPLCTFDWSYDDDVPESAGIRPGKSRRQ
jgi:hypothetical protein